MLWQMVLTQLAMLLGPCFKGFQEKRCGEFYFNFVVCMLLFIYLFLNLTSR